MTSLKGPGDARSYDGSTLRIGIVHARWNSTIVDALVGGAKNALLAAGVREENVVVQSVPGSYELPYAVQRMCADSGIEVSAAAGSSSTSTSSQRTRFDAVIAIGVLIKGETMHFEFIADAVSHGLMRVQLDSHTPVIFGVLTVMTEDQGLVRAGLEPKNATSETARPHNHGEDWGKAAVELAVKSDGCFWRIP